MIIAKTDKLIKKFRGLASSNRKFMRYLYDIKYFTSEPRPNRVGTQYYRKNSSWDYIDSCPCDIEFVEYLKKTGVENKTIFHFGTGAHHLVGLENQKLSNPNDVIGITACDREHHVYASLFVKERELAKYYKVILGDIYTLTARCLPMLDIVTLFHLCEYYLPEDTLFVHHDDESLLSLFLDKLNPDGKILFFKNSFTWDQAKSIIELFEDKGKIKKIESYKSLEIYQKVI
jgi:SAM-dependent methyltransferase